MPQFTEFETDPDAESGVFWEAFVDGLTTWVAMQDGSPSVAAAAAAWNTTPGAIRTAVNDSIWLVDMWSDDEEDPAKQIIACDGE